MFLKSAALCSRIAEAVGLYALGRAWNKEKTIILMYHGVTSDNDPVANYDHKHIERERLEGHLQYLKKHYSIISLDDYIIWRKGEKRILPPNSLIITFDDGYTNNYTQLFPLLSRYDIPATIFLPTAYIGKKQVAWYDIVTYCIYRTKKKKLIIDSQIFDVINDKQKIEAIMKLKRKIRTSGVLRTKIIAEVVKETEIDPTLCEEEDFLFLSWEQCKKIKKSKITFGSHSCTHEYMTDLSEEKFKKEVCESKKIIETELGEPCLAFAYPFGEYNEKVRIALKNTDYFCAVTTTFGSNAIDTDVLRLYRIVLNNLYDTDHLPLIFFIKFTYIHHKIQKMIVFLKEIIIPRRE